MVTQVDGFMLSNTLAYLLIYNRTDYSKIGQVNVTWSNQTMTVNSVDPASSNALPPVGINLLITSRMFHILNLLASAFKKLMLEFNVSRVRVIHFGID